MKHYSILNHFGNKQEKYDDFNFYMKDLED